jgi:hypothetical protein
VAASEVQLASTPSYRPIRIPSCKVEHDLDEIFAAVFEYLKRGLPEAKIRELLTEQNELFRIMAYDLLDEAMTAAFKQFKGSFNRKNRFLV